jgi:hypothetical protein
MCNYLSFAPSLDGRGVVESRTTSSGADLWLVDAERSVSSRSTFEPGLNVYPICFSQWPVDHISSGNPWNLYRKDSSGLERQWPNDWSRNGRFLLMRVHRSNGLDLLFRQFKF